MLSPKALFRLIKMSWLTLTDVGHFFKPYEYVVPDTSTDVDSTCSKCPRSNFAISTCCNERPGLPDTTHQRLSPPTEPSPTHSLVRSSQHPDSSLYYDPRTHHPANYICKGYTSPPPSHHTPRLQPTLSLAVGGSPLRTDLRAQYNNLYYWGKRRQAETRCRTKERPTRDEGGSTWMKSSRYYNSTVVGGAPHTVEHWMAKNKKL